MDTQIQVPPLVVHMDVDHLTLHSVALHLEMVVVVAMERSALEEVQMEVLVTMLIWVLLVIAKVSAANTAIMKKLISRDLKSKATLEAQIADDHFLFQIKAVH